MSQSLSSRIERIEWGTLEGKRPRSAGCNARLAAHGDTIRMPIVRLTTADGASGFGVCRAKPEEVIPLVDAVGPQGLYILIDRRVTPAVAEQLQAALETRIK